MNFPKLVRLAAAAAAFSSAAAWAAPVAFDFESSSPGFYSSLTDTNGGVTLTLTTEGSGFVSIETSDIPLLGSQSAVGSQTDFLKLDGFQKMRFSFSQVINSITFLYGDGGGDSDTPVVIEAYSADNSLLGTFMDIYDAGVSSGRSGTLNFTGASYFITSSGLLGQNADSIYFEVQSAEVGGTVPEPGTLALVGSALACLSLVSRRKRI